MLRDKRRSEAQRGSRENRHTISDELYLLLYIVYIHNSGISKSIFFLPATEEVQFINNSWRRHGEQFIYQERSIRSIEFASADTFADLARPSAECDISSSGIEHMVSSVQFRRAGKSELRFPPFILIMMKIAVQLCNIFIQGESYRGKSFEPSICHVARQRWSASSAGKIPRNIFI